MHNLTRSSDARGITVNRSCDAANRLLNIAGYVEEPRTYSHDAAGNITLTDHANYYMQDVRYTYGDNNRPRQITAGTWNTTLQGFTTVNSDIALRHNGLGQRVALYGNGTAQPPTKTLHFDEAGHVLAEYGANGPKYEYIYLDDLPVAYYYYAASNGGGTATLYYLHTDALGTPRYVSTTAGALSASASSSDPFADDISPYYTWAPRLRFPGQYYLPETGMYYNYFRDYDPVTGRYLQPDPIGLAGGLNPFQYANDNPLRWVDPLGLTTLVFYPGSGNLHVFPERRGEEAYIIPASSGRQNCSCDSSSLKEGPIPSGGYTLYQNEITNPGVIGDIARNLRGDWGDWRAPLHPDAGTQTFGRSGFFLHGGSFAGSAGCIDVGGGTFGNELTDRLLQDLMSDPDGVIPIIVTAPSPNGPQHR